MTPLGTFTKTSLEDQRNSTATQPCSPLRAAERARLLFGQFRRGEAADPEIWVASVVKLLSTYPESVVVYVTDPVSGLARRSPFIPSLHEIGKACDDRLALTPGAQRTRIVNDGPRPVQHSSEHRETMRKRMTELSARLASEGGGNV